MKNILLLTDFSKNAENAISYALQFFRGGAFDFTIMNVQKSSKYTTVDLLTTSTSTSSVYDSVIKNPKAHLKEMVDTLKEKFKKEQFSFTEVCDFDQFIDAVNQAVKHCEIDLIIMGTNGATGAQEVFFGSNTINVIRQVHCPVLVIPEGFVYRKPLSIAFISENDEILDVHALKILKSMISFQASSLDVLFLGNAQDIATIEFKKEKIAQHFPTSEHSFHTVFDVPADVAIDTFVQLYKSDIVAKIVNVKPFIKRLTLGKKLAKITYKSCVPLLLMHPGD